MNKEEFLGDNIYEKIFRILYNFLMLNVLFSLTNKFLFLVISSTALVPQNIFLIIISAVFFIPSIYTILDCFKKWSDNKYFNVVEEYFKSIKVAMKTTLGLNFIFLLTSLVLIVDFLAAFKIEMAWLFPIYIVVCYLFIANILSYLYFKVQNKDKPIINIWKYSLFYTLKKWYLSILSTILFVIFILGLTLSPPVGFFVTPSILIGAIYLNSSRLTGTQEIKNIFYEKK